MLNPSRRVLPERSHAGHQHSGGQWQVLCQVSKEHESGQLMSFWRITFQLLLLDELPFSTERNFSLRNQCRSSEVRSCSLRAAVEVFHLSHSQSPVFLSQYSLSVTLSFKGHCHYVISCYNFLDYHLFYISYICDGCFPEHEQGKPSPSHNDL